jgi:hypothetical protein
MVNYVELSIAALPHYYLRIYHPTPDSVRIAEVSPGFILRALAEVIVPEWLKQAKGSAATVETLSVMSEVIGRPHIPNQRLP